MTPVQLEGNPHPLLAELREREPVSWVPALSGWLVTGRLEAIAAMRDAETFTVDDPRFSTAQVVGPSMLSLDGAEHRRHRDPFVEPFHHRQVHDRLADKTRARARHLVAAMAPGGGGDLRAGLAAPLAVEVMAEVLGFEGADTAEVLGWYEAIVSAVEGVTAGDPVSEGGVLAFRHLTAAVESILEESSEALLSIVHAQGDLSPAEVVSNAAVLMFGGIVTSDGSTASAFHLLLSHPDQLELVLEDRSLVANAVEEAFRLEPAAAVVDRYATRDSSLGGVSIRAGELVMVSLAAANRDPAVFAEPDRFDVRRENLSQHLAFARGPHACLGIHLARLECQAAVAAALDGLEGLAGAVLDAPRGLIFRAPSTVRATWR